MGDIDNRHALAGQFADHPKQDFHFGFTQRRRGFVEDQNIRVFRQRFGDFHQLLLAHFQVRHLLIRRNRLVETPEQFSTALNLCGFINRLQPLLQLAAQKDVFRHGKVFKQVELLMHHADTVGGGVAGRGEMHRFAVQFDGPGARLLHPGEDFH